MVFVPFASVLALAAVVSGASALPRVDPKVHRTLRQQGIVNIIVTFKGGNAPAIASALEANHTSRAAKIEALVNQLERHALSTQAELQNVLFQVSTLAGPLFSSTQSFWISNQVYFKDASFTLVEKLAGLFSIAEIREEVIGHLSPMKPAADDNTTSSSLLANEWGVTKVQAPSVWANGNTGQGVVVSTIDSGALHTHTRRSGATGGHRTDGMIQRPRRRHLTMPTATALTRWELSPVRTVSVWHLARPGSRARAAEMICAQSLICWRVPSSLRVRLTPMEETGTAPRRRTS